MATNDALEAQEDTRRLRRIAERARRLGAHALASRLEAMATEYEAQLANPRRVGAEVHT